MATDADAGHSTSRSGRREELIGGRFIMAEESVVPLLQNRITELEHTLAKVRAEAKQRREKIEALTAEKENLTAENKRFASALEEVAHERDQYKAAIEAEPHALQAQVNEYRGKLRDRDHRDKFRELAAAAGVTNPKALDDLYQLSGYKPEADEIDEKKLTAAIGQALQGRDWLKSPAPAADAANGQPAGSGTQTAQGARLATLQPGPGASRGGASVKDDTDSVLEAKYPNAFRIA
jgi:hypothetical protein